MDDARSLHRAGQTEKALAAYARVVDDGTQADSDRAAAANNACVILLESGRYEQALASCQLARELRIAGDDRARLPRTLNNLGATFEALGRYDDANRTYLEALELNRASGDNESITINLANLGVLATQRAEYGAALLRYLEVERLARSALPAQWARDQLVLAAINRGVVFERIGAYREALDAYRSVADQVAELATARQATWHVNVGVAYRNLGDPVRAMAELDRADALYTRGDDRAGLAGVWLDRGIIAHFNYRDYGTAEAAYERALDMAEATSLFDVQLVGNYYLAWLALDQQHIERARHVFGEVLDMARSRDARDAQWSALEGLARCAARDGDYRTASGHLEQAMKLIEETRAGLTPGGLRQAFFASQRRVYSQAIEVAWQSSNRTDNVSDAYLVSQRAKARELLASLPLSITPMNVSDVAKRLGAPLLEYFVSEQAIYGWYIAPGAVQMHRWDAPDDLLTGIGRMGRQQVTAESLQALAAELLTPFTEALTSTDRLIVAPDGVLYRLPFDALAAGADPPVVVSHVVTYVPSGSVVAGLSARQEYRRELVAIGAPSVDPTDISYANQYQLPALPGARQELEIVSGLIAGQQQLLTGADATENTVLEALRVGASIAHFATHTVLDDRLGPAIVLSPSDNSDGLLFPAEIAAAAPLAIGVTVLAACSSGLGGIENGRAIGSLTGALLSAGSTAVLATLWDVDDAYTTEFMTVFYRQLADGIGPAQALARTKRRLRGSGADWAAFVLFGDNPAPPAWRPRYGLLIAALFLAGMAIWLRLRPA